MYATRFEHPARTKRFGKEEEDEWYKNKCAEKIKVPDEFNQIKGLKKIEVRDLNNPSGEINIHLQDLSGENGFI